MSLLAQATLFGITMLTGMVLGLWLDLFRFINRRGRGRLFPILDLLFWAVTTCIIFVVLMNTNYLQLRMYVFIGLGLGILLYLKILSRHILHLYSWGFEFILKMIKCILRVLRPLTLPARVASGMLDVLIEAVLGMVMQVIILVFRSSKQDNPPAA